MSLRKRTLLNLLSVYLLLALLTACLPQDEAQQEQAQDAAQAEATPAEDATPAEAVADVQPREITQPPRIDDDPLRVCMLGFNLPLSQEEPDKQNLRGLYYDIASALAQKMGKELSVHYVMHAFYSRPARHGLLMGNCALQIGLPRGDRDYTMGRKVGLTEAFTTVGYAIVLPKGKQVNSLRDLAGMTVAIQPGSPPQEILNGFEKIETVLIKDPDPVFDLIESGEIDAAFVWGPSVGYLNKYQYDGKFDIVATDMQFPVAIGMLAEQMGAKHELDAHLQALQPLIKKLRETYGLPKGPQVKVKQHLPYDMEG